MFIKVYPRLSDEAFEELNQLIPGAKWSFENDNIVTVIEYDVIAPENIEKIETFFMAGHGVWFSDDKTFEPNYTEEDEFKHYITFAVKCAEEMLKSEIYRYFSSASVEELKYFSDYFRSGELAKKLDAAIPKYKSAD
jgi:hypothetical protein